MKDIMKTRMKTWMAAAALMAWGCGALCCSCKGGKATTEATETEHPLVAGTLEEALKPDSAPAEVMLALQNAERYHNYEIMCDTASALCVEAIGEADTTPTEGYGIVVEKGAASTPFLSLNHARQPKAWYDAKKGELWYANCAMWGTGVQVERLYLMRFGKDNKASIVHVVDPYEVQQLLCQRLGYSIEGARVTFYDGSSEIADGNANGNANGNADLVSEMGGFDSERPLWIGEQIEYDLDAEGVRVLVTPGVKFTTGLVLTYDGMPTLAAPISIGKDGRLNIGTLSAVKGQPEP